MRVLEVEDKYSQILQPRIEKGSGLEESLELNLLEPKVSKERCSSLWVKL